MDLRPFTSTSCAWVSAISTGRLAAWSRIVLLYTASVCTRSGVGIPTSNEVTTEVPRILVPDLSCGTYVDFNGPIGPCTGPDPGIGNGPSTVW